MTNEFSNIYEINTRLWVRELSAKHGKSINLDSVPVEEIDEIKKLGFDAVWLMGVWLPSKKGRYIAISEEGLMKDLKAALPNFMSEDIVSSPYSIAGYTVDGFLGGVEGLLKFKGDLNARGLKLILDFVPNHLAADHPWVTDNPDLFIKGKLEDIVSDPGTYFYTDNTDILAHGKDPYFPAWTDVVQLNYFNPETRQAMIGSLSEISRFCDGLRCDMAMLIQRSVQKTIWGEKVYNNGKYVEPATEFWQEAIASVKEKYPDFIFVAEVYWGLDNELIECGFDYVYDKSFYDALRETNPIKVNADLNAWDEFSDKRLKFIENHDEKRAAAEFGEARSKAAALIMSLSPGAHMYHQGQFEGLKVKIPVQLIRRSFETINQNINIFYTRLLPLVIKLRKDFGDWSVFRPLRAWEGNLSNHNFVGFFNNGIFIAAINYSPYQSQCYVRLNFKGFKSDTLLFKDMMSTVEYVRGREDVASRGLYLDMPAFGFHIFKISDVTRAD